MSKLIKLFLLLLISNNVNADIVTTSGVLQVLMNLKLASFQI